MPSWNLHAYHTKKLLDNPELSLREYFDPDAFMLGNIAPDIYVGYMVNPISKKLPYEVTHCADTQIIPVPNTEKFYELYIEPALKEGKVPDAMAVGAWLHLITDSHYNDSTRFFLKQRGLTPCSALRIKKQADYARFGKQVCPEIEIIPNEEALKEAKRFAQYPIEEEDARRAIDTFNNIVRKDSKHPEQKDDYQLFNQKWFDTVSKDVQNVLESSVKRIQKNIKK